MMKTRKDLIYYRLLFPDVGISGTKRKRWRFSQTDFIMTRFFFVCIRTLLSLIYDIQKSQLQDSYLVIIRYKVFLLF